MYLIHVKCVIYGINYKNRNIKEHKGKRESENHLWCVWIKEIVNNMEIDKWWDLHSHHFKSQYL